MRILFSVLLLITFINGYSQINFESDTSKIALYPEITSRIRKLPQDFDFQLRFWTGGGMVVPSEYDLFILTFKNGIWKSQTYKITYKKGNKFRIVENKKIIENCDSIWDYFMKNEILNLPDMRTLKRDFYPIHETSDTGIITFPTNRGRFVVLDGAIYTFEFIKAKGYKRIEYHCPVTYGKRFTHIREFQLVTNIIRLIYKNIGKNYDPC